MNTSSNPGAKQDSDYVLDRYASQIRYYWRAAAANKRFFRMTRYLVIILGAVVTLTTAFGSADFVQGNAALSLAFKVCTPILAGILTILGGFSQTFQWDAAWKEMVMTAGRLERERDRIVVTPVADRNAADDLMILNDLVIQETAGFFDRLLGKTQASGPIQRPAAPSVQPQRSADGPTPRPAG